MLSGSFTVLCYAAVCCWLSKIQSTSSQLLLLLNTSSINSVTHAAPSPAAAAAALGTALVFCKLPGCSLKMLKTAATPLSVHYS